MGKPLDLTGQKFGKLTAIRRLDEKKGRMFFWECLCDCGNTCKVVGTYLKNGNTKSCGCEKYSGLKAKNLRETQRALIPIGTKFGKLTVIQDLGLLETSQKDKNRRFYLCQCECGNTKIVMGNCLKQGQTQSCGSCITSKGEEKIKQLLNSAGIKYDYDVPFSELTDKYGRRLRFDFIIYKNNGEIDRFVEFDGKQHYNGPDTEYWGHSTDTLQTIQEKDKIKNQFCYENNYKLIRIPYYDLNKFTLEDIFSEKYLMKGGIYCD